MTGLEGLSDADQEKLDARLVLWLSGEGGWRELRFAPPEPETVEEVRIVMELTEPLTEDVAPTYGSLGIDVLTDTTVLYGQVSRETLVALAQDPRVAQIHPDAQLLPFDPSSGAWKEP